MQHAIIYRDDTNTFRIWQGGLSRKEALAELLRSREDNREDPGMTHWQLVSQREAEQMANQPYRVC